MHFRIRKKSKRIKTKGGIEKDLILALIQDNTNFTLLPTIAFQNDFYHKKIAIGFLFWYISICLQDLPKIDYNIGTIND